MRWIGRSDGAPDVDCRSNALPPLRRMVTTSPTTAAQRFLDRHWFGFLLLHAVLLQTITFVLRPMTSYRAIELGAPVFWLGALSACFALVPLVVAIPSGRATDHLGERPIMIAGAALIAAAAAAFLLLRDWLPGLAVANIVLGTGHLLSVVSEQAVVANRADDRHFDAVFGRYTFAAAVGQTAGPALLVVAGGGREYPDATLAFGLALAISGGLFLSTLAIRSRQRGDAAATSTSPHASIGSILRLPGIPRAVIASSVTLSAVDILTVYLPALGLQLGMSAGVVGALLAIRSGASMLSRFFVGALAVRLGRRRLLLASVLGASITMFALVLPAPAVAIAVVVGAAGFALGLAQPLAMAWLAEVSPLGMRGTAMSLRLAGNRLGQTVVPMSIGFVAAATGVAGVVAVTGAVLVAAGIAVRGATDG
jgi:MFS family permease